MRIIEIRNMVQAVDHARHLVGSINDSMRGKDLRPGSPDRKRVDELLKLREQAEQIQDTLTEMLERATETFAETGVQGYYKRVEILDNGVHVYQHEPATPEWFRDQPPSEEDT